MGVVDVSRISLEEIRCIVATHVGAVEGLGEFVIVGGESSRQRIAVGKYVIELAEIFVVIIDRRRRGVEIAGGRSGNQTVLEISLGNWIDAGRIDDALSSERGV